MFRPFSNSNNTANLPTFLFRSREIFRIRTLGIVLRKVAKFSKYFHQNRGRLPRVPWQKEQRFHDELELLL